MYDEDPQAPATPLAGADLISAVEKAVSAFQNPNRDRVASVADVLAGTRVPTKYLIRALNEGPEIWDRSPTPRMILSLALGYLRDQRDAPLVDGRPEHGLRPLTYGSQVGDPGDPWAITSAPGARAYLQDAGPGQARVYQDGPRGIRRAGLLTVDPVGIARHTPQGKDPKDHPRWGRPLAADVQIRIFGRVLGPGEQPMPALRAALRSWVSGAPRPTAPPTAASTAPSPVPQPEEIDAAPPPADPFEEWADL